MIWLGKPIRQIWTVKLQLESKNIHNTVTHSPKTPTPENNELQNKESAKSKTLHSKARKTQKNNEPNLQT